MRSPSHLAPSCAGFSSKVTAETLFGKKGQGVRAPIAIAPELASLKYTFAKPAKVTVVGSYLLRSVAKPTQNVDLAVEIPSETLEVKDQLNYRYLHKRAYYLGSVSSLDLTTLSLTLTTLSPALTPLPHPVLACLLPAETLPADLRSPYFYGGTKQPSNDLSMLQPAAALAFC